MARRLGETKQENREREAVYRKRKKARRESDPTLMARYKEMVRKCKATQAKKKRTDPVVWAQQKAHEQTLKREQRKQNKKFITPEEEELRRLRRQSYSRAANERHNKRLADDEVYAAKFRERKRIVSAAYNSKRYCTEKYRIQQRDAARVRRAAMTEEEVKLDRARRRASLHARLGTMPPEERLARQNRMNRSGVQSRKKAALRDPAAVEAARQRAIKATRAWVARPENAEKLRLARERYRARKEAKNRQKNFMLASVALSKAQDDVAVQERIDSVRAARERHSKESRRRATLAWRARQKENKRRQRQDPIDLADS